MATDYPGGLDSFPLPGANLSTNPHSSLHTDVQDAVEAIQAELGVNPSGTFSTVADRVAAGTADPGSVTYEKLHQANIWTPLYAAWTSYNPTWTNVSTGTGTTVSRAKRVGTMCFCHWELIFESGSSVSGVPQWQLPFAPRSNSGHAGSAVFVPNGGKPIHRGIWAFGSTVKVLEESHASGFWTDSNPMGVTAGNRVFMDLVYETGSVPSTGSLV